MTSDAPAQNSYTKKALRPFIIPVFIPHAGCPHRCAFCNQALIANRPKDPPSKESVTAEIARFLTYHRPHHEAPQISFYGGTFLGIGKEWILRFLGIAEGFVSRGQAASIRFSTRPDTITQETLDAIQRFPVKTVELGVQSMDDTVLKLSLRGHSAHDTRRAVDRLKKGGYTVGLQMMVGLPGQDASSAMTTALELAGLSPDFVRIYPTIVLKNSRLETWYQKGTYTPLSLDAAVTQTKGLLAVFRDKQIPVVRMGLQASESLDLDRSIIAGPYHPAFGHLVHSEFFFDRAAAALASQRTPIHKAVFFVHPSSLPKMRGLKNANITRLKKIFHINHIELVPDASISDETLRVEVGET
ncbi:MAG: radical SAM protein [Deltaproteobacteria bacterium]|jgi:histone acetyltransferase (RNA polymerase elongator complex component)|nr:radical SAM protein [Deltaproteobacteria bacterium]